MRDFFAALAIAIIPPAWVWMMWRLRVAKRERLRGQEGGSGIVRFGLMAVSAILLLIALRIIALGFLLALQQHPLQTTAIVVACVAAIVAGAKWLVSDRSFRRLDDGRSDFHNIQLLEEAEASRLLRELQEKE